MGVINLILNSLSDIWQRRSTIKGLFIFLLLSNIVSFSFFAFILKIPIFEIYFKQIYPYIYFGFAYILLHIIVVVIWLYFRSPPQHNSERNLILFAPHYDDECTKFIHSIYENFKEEICRREFNKLISCKFLPPNISVKNHEEANTILQSTGCRLIIHGKFDRGELAGEKIHGFKAISFTIKSRNLDQNELKPFLRDFANALAYREFTTNEKNSFIDKSIVISHIADVSTFLICLSLTVDGEIEFSIPILRKLYDEVAHKQKIKPQPQLNFFLSSIRNCLTVALDAQFNVIYDKFLVDSIGSRNVNSDKAANECSKIIDELLQLNKKKSIYFLRKAILDFHFGKIKEAFDAANKARDLSPSNDPAPHFSLAFLYLWTSDWTRCLSEYRKVKNCTNHDIRVVRGVLFFLQSILDSHPEKSQIYFALGFINENFYDLSRAVQDYEALIEQATQNISLKSLSLYASRRLTKLKNIDCQA